MPKFIDCEQGGAEWFAARCGRITGSRLMDVMAYLKSGAPAQKRQDYILEIAAERLTGLTKDRYKSPAMQWGTDHESEARCAYEMAADDLVVPVGFAVHPELDFTGASPDGIIGEQGILEIKCPETTTHLQYIRDGVVPEEYRAQMTWEMVCCEREWGDFVSYDPRMLDEDLRLFVVRYPLDCALARKIEAEVWKFNQEVNETIASLRKPRALNDQLRGSIALA